MSTSTTLITFILRAPEGTFGVELLGSWDNFSKPYKLDRDRRTGDHSWRGCHFFEGITCDGDTSDLSAMRNGGLMMGGTYWYYYRLNSETEYHDPSEPYTSSCPLLPGQPVNVLDVPNQPRRPSSDSDSSESLEAIVFTLDPKDKYLPPGVRRARTTSAIQQPKALVRQTSRLPLSTADRNFSESTDRPPTADSMTDGPTLRPQRSLVSMFDKLRRTKSAGSSSPRAVTSWHRKVFSRGSSKAGLKPESSWRAPPPEDIPAVPQLPQHILAREGNDHPISTPSPNLSYVNPAACATMNPTVSLGATMGGLGGSKSPEDRSHEQVPGESVDSEEATFYHMPNTTLYRKVRRPGESEAVEPDSCQIVEAPIQREGLNDLPSETNNISENAVPRSTSRCVPIRSHLSESEAQVYTLSPTFLDDDSELGEQDEAMFGLSSANSSCATDETFSPPIPSWSAQSVPISPMQLSQPETPTTSEFDDDAASWKRGSDLIDVDTVHLRAPSRAAPLPPPSSQAPTFANPFKTQASLSGFQGYSLPQNEQGSVHTLRKPASTTSFHTDHPLRHQASSEDLVHAWNDGSAHRVTALEDLIDDHGYLGAFIL